MTMVDGSTLLTTIFVLVDDWYQQRRLSLCIGLLRKKVDALCVHVAAKVTSHTLRVFLRQRFGIDVLTFEQHPVP